MKVRNITGYRFGSLVALREDGRDKYKRAKWLCKCDCGNLKTLLSANLTQRNTNSCGCERGHRITESKITHGMRKTRFYCIFAGLKQRCNNKNHHKYRIYGSRGIKCLWDTFEEFRDDMYESYVKHVRDFGEKQTTIDRIDVNGNYCKVNCRWATWSEQAFNKRKKVISCNV